MLLRDFSQVTLSISATTRPKRPSEQEGIHYFFLPSKEEFRKRIQGGEFAEWAEVHGQYYGTPREPVDRWLSEGKHVLFDIDVQGAMSLLKIYRQRVLLVFIHAPSMDVLEQRLRHRKGDSLPSIETRLQNAYNELEWSKSFDYQITNDNLDRAYAELKEIVKKECL